MRICEIVSQVHARLAFALLHKMEYVLAWLEQATILDFSRRPLQGKHFAHMSGNAGG